MTRGALAGAALLFGVSAIVRIIPSFLRVTFSEETREDVRSVLPVAVFLNLIAYCLASEADGNPAAAAAGFALLFTLMLVTKRVGLPSVVGIASFAFILLKR